MWTKIITVIVLCVNGHLVVKLSIPQDATCQRHANISLPRRARPSVNAPLVSILMANAEHELTQRIQKASLICTTGSGTQIAC